MKQLRWLREEPKSHVFFLFFFFLFFLSFFHAFIVLRYKKLRAALAMERTKPIIQNSKTKEIISSCPPRLLKVLGPKTNCPSFPTETKYKEITTLKLLLICAFLGGGSYVREKIKQQVSHGAEKIQRKQNLRGKTSYLGVEGGVEGVLYWSGRMFGGNPVFVSVMYSPKARMRVGADHIGASCAREETSFSRRFRTRVRAGQVRTACWKDSGPAPQRAQVGSGFSLDQEGWAAR